MFKLRSGFIVGGLVGAAAAMALSRKRPDAAARIANAVSNVGSRAATWAVSGWANRSWEKAASTAPKSLSDTDESSKADLATVEALIESDPAVKQEVSRIREEASGLH